MWDAWGGVLADIGVGLAAFGLTQLAAARIVRPPPGAALALHGRGPTTVALGSRLRRIGQRCAVIPLGPHVLAVSLRGEDAAISRDGRRVDVVAQATLALPRDAAVIREVVESLGLAVPADAAALHGLFAAHLCHALRAVVSTFTGADIYARHDELRARVIELATPHLRGYQIADLAIASAQLIARDAAAPSEPLRKPMTEQPATGQPAMASSPAQVAPRAADRARPARRHRSLA